GPEDFSGAALGLVLGLLAAGSGFRVPVGGARAITHALLRRLEEAGGPLRLNSRGAGIVARQGRAGAGRTQRRGEMALRRGGASPAEVGGRPRFRRRRPPHPVSGYLRWAMGRFRYGWGTFKMDWALAGPVPWTVEQARQAAVVHAGDSIDDLIAFTNQVRAG